VVVAGRLLKAAVERRARPSRADDEFALLAMLGLPLT
jgi:hypothetical protein